MNSKYFVIGVCSLVLAGCVTQNATKDTTGAVIGTQKKIEITRSESKISIIGDDSFVLDRVKGDYSDRYSETVGFSGGMIRYQEVYGYTYFPDYLGSVKNLEILLSSDWAKNKGLIFVASNVKDQNVKYGVAKFMLSELPSNYCFFWSIMFGRETHSGNPNKNALMTACESKAQHASKQGFEEKYLAIATRIRFDGGAINRAKGD